MKLKSSITNFLSTVLFLLLILTSKFFAQVYEVENNLSVGIGNSLYKNIQTEQLILFYKLPELSTRFGNFSVNSDVNFELISVKSSTIMVAGYVPMLRYNLDLGNVESFISAGIGINYLNNHNIAARNLGSHFIFSDMISIGSSVYHSNNFDIEISYLIRHISNAGIYRSNEGFNSQYLVVSIII